MSEKEGHKQTTLNLPETYLYPRNETETESISFFFFS